MNFATWSIRNPAPVLLLFVILSLAGLYSFKQLPIAALPDMDLPEVNVELQQPGAAPAQMETEVVHKVEDSLAKLSGLKHLQTSIKDGRAQIQVSFVLGKKISDALIETKDAVDRVRSSLPAELLQPSVSARHAGSDALRVYTVVSARLDEEALSWYVDDAVAKAVLGVPGVGRFERIGGVQRQVQVEVDSVRLAALGLTSGEVSRAVRSMQQEVSGGRTKVGGAEQGVRTGSAILTADALSTFPIVANDGRRVTLEQVATVSDTQAERDRIALLDGKRVVGFAVYRAQGADETRVDSGVGKVLDGLRAHDAGLTFTRISGSVDGTREQFSGSMAMLYEGAILAVLVVWMFLRDWRATLVAASALPLSILPAFAVMFVLDYSLNTLTLLALAVVVGILVDDAIVEIENIERHRAKGKPIREAVAEAVTEIATAVIATTMTLVAVFLPTAMMGGIAGRFFQHFGWTTVVAVLASLLVARMLTPLMAVYLLRAEASPTHKRPQAESCVMRCYVRGVRWCLRHRRSALAATVLVFAASVALLPLLKTGFIPAPNKGYSQVAIELPPGESLDDTVAVAEQARRALERVEGIERVMTSAGGAGAGADGANRATLTLVFAPRDKRPSQTVIEQHARAALVDIPGARFSLGAGGPGEKLSLILTSDNAPLLTASVRSLEQQLRAVPGLSNITSTATLERPELVVRPDLDQAAERGVTTATLGETIRVATAGDSDSRLARLNLDRRQLDVLVRLPEAQRKDLDAIAALRVQGREGLVPLDSVAHLSIESGPAEIRRYDRRRFSMVTADLGGTPLGEALQAARRLPALASLPSGVQLIATGDAEVMTELMGSFALAMVFGFLCVYAVLILLFHDAFQPLTILSAVPLSVGGAFVALLIAGSALTLPSLIGFVMLMGIVTKNSILLVDHAGRAMRDGNHSMNQALVEACRLRARPIIMTTVAMVAGMLPIAIGFGADASFRQPMAIAVIGGLVSSTALSLFAVPVIFTYVAGLERRLLGIRTGGPSAAGGT